MAKETKVPEYVAVIPFEDAVEYITDGTINSYKEGDDVSHFEPSRIERLIERGIVKKAIKE